MASDKIKEIVYGYSTDISQLEEENRILKETTSQLKTELDKYKNPPLMVCEVKDFANGKVIIKIPNGNEFLVDIDAGCGELKVGDSVLVEQKNLTIISKIGLSTKFNAEKFVIIEKPNVSWDDIGGMEKQINEIKEVIELPLKKPELFEKIGIQPPKGILLHGRPGTGKTLLAKAVASSTNSTFIEIVASELVQKFIGEGAKLVKEIFELAREKAPSIVFIDELDALASKRIELGTSGEREVQRTFMQLLAEIDGFKHLGNVKIIGATNRRDILDSAIIRPGRLERRIHVPLPGANERKAIFGIHTRRMSMDNINFDRFIKPSEGFSGADIKAVCTEAGYFTIRDDRMKVLESDFQKAIKKITSMREHQSKDYLSMFG